MGWQVQFETPACDQLDCAFAVMHVLDAGLPCRGSDPRILG